MKLMDNIGRVVGIMSMVSFSETYSQASTAQRDILEIVRVTVTSLRNWAHYTSLIFSGCTLFVFYSILYRFDLVPRPLAGFGIGAVVLQLFAVSMPLFGNDVVFLLLAPLGLSQIALSAWLIVKGFQELPASG